MKAPLGFLPEARREGIISKEVDGELLVYDLERDKAHCLNLTAALVWKNCNGRRSIPELARVLSKELDTAIDEAVIQLAIKQLDRDHLLAAGDDATPLPTDLSRRAVIRRLGVAAVLLPLITSISAPTARANVSCVTPMGGCVPNGPNNGGCSPGCTCSALDSTCVTI
jgi:coenzyme PQQ synthesis protein D (PqqD)